MKHLILILAGLMMLSCTRNDADYKQQQQQEQMSQEAYKQTGLPGITNFTERKFTKMLYELRDSEMATFSYYTDMYGNLHKLCRSIGYGIPYSVQYVSPEKATWYRDHGRIALPQAEPNGLFMPDTLSATWVLCSDGKGGVRPVYWEPSLVVSPFELPAKGEFR